MKSLNLTSTKKGAASIYVVVFATILFGVITLSFIRIIMSESSQTSNDDLSQSAYDAAMAGVEDAKIAVNKYYQCKSNPNGENCSLYENLFASQDCTNYPLASILYKEKNGGDEVKITESSGSESSNNTDQAYTCVLLSNLVDDYRATLSSDTRTKVVPIGIGSSSLAKVKYIKFEWYSELNGTSETFTNLNHGGKLRPKSSTTIPPTISLSLIKTGSSFSLKDFNNSTSNNFSTMILLPSGVDKNATNVITLDTINAAANSNSENSPFQITCQGGAFACSVQLGNKSTGLGFEANGNAMLVISLPYGDTVTDFAVTLYDDQDKQIPFENVQISVDSTGRTNQLVRRVETRLDPADNFFPYPQYEVELNGGDDNALVKNFWITANCWTENDYCRNNSDLSND